jgi:Na+-translocating ferredoxin:NAD+ oxidoreductase RnfC subunit
MTSLRRTIHARFRASAHTHTPHKKAAKRVCCFAALLCCVVCASKMTKHVLDMHVTDKEIAGHPKDSLTTCREGRRTTASVCNPRDALQRRVGREYVGSSLAKKLAHEGARGSGLQGRRLEHQQSWLVGTTAAAAPGSHGCLAAEKRQPSLEELKTTAAFPFQAVTNREMFRILCMVDHVAVCHSDSCYVYPEHF